MNGLRVRNRAHVYNRKQKTIPTFITVTSLQMAALGCARCAEILTAFKLTHKNLGVQAPQDVEFK